MTPAQRAEYTQLIDTRDSATTPAEESAAVAELEAFERRVIAGNSSWFASIIATVFPPAAPFSTQIMLALVGMVPLAGDRGRKHFKDMMREASPIAKGPTGTRMPNPVAAVKSLGKYVGAFHTVG
jgi:hypothetical protein